MNTEKHQNIFFIITIVLIAIGSIMRLLPHPANFTPIAALAFFGGVYLNKKYAFFLPLVALAISDLFLPDYPWTMRITVYSSFSLVGLIGLRLRNHTKWYFVAGGTLLGSILFYLITNAAVWAFSPLYENTFAGLMQSYYYALPFFRNMILGDLFYVGVFFGAYEVVKILIYKWQERSKKVVMASD